ncbi:MAG: hypothetical protein ACETVY_07055 [Candidatus Bathyarchaeia archaeon]
MSGYRVGAFEALEWTWYMLRSYRGRPSGIDEARRAIQDVLMNMGRGDEVDFGDKILQTEAYS